MALSRKAATVNSRVANIVNVLKHLLLLCGQKRNTKRSMLEQSTYSGTLFSGLDELGNVV